MHSEHLIVFSRRFITFNRAENEVWHANPDLDLSTIPMPSLYFGFPVLKTDQKSTRGFQKDSTFDNYTLPRLSLFTKHGLYWVPVAECRFEEDGLQPRPVCFPWAIVQVFGTLLSDRVNDSYYKDLVSEASAAASAALSVFETLARFADEKHDGQHIPPVCIITSMGAKTTVWLAYCNIVDDRLRDHVRTLLPSFLKTSKTSKENDKHMGRQYHQNMGCHSILPYHRQYDLLGTALFEAYGYEVYRSMETEILPQGPGYLLST